MAKLLISNPIWSPRNFFQRHYLDNVPSYHPIQKGKMAKLNFGLNIDQKFFSKILSLLHGTHCCKLPLYEISRKTNEANLRK